MRPNPLSPRLGQPPPGFESRVVTIGPRSGRRFVEGEWRDAIVVVDRGEVDLELLGGGRGRFGSGAMLWLTGLPVRSLRNRGREHAVLVATRRLVRR
jgi:hypothetical protein